MQFGKGVPKKRDDLIHRRRVPIPDSHTSDLLQSTVSEIRQVDGISDITSIVPRETFLPSRHYYRSKLSLPTACMITSINCLKKALLTEEQSSNRGRTYHYTKSPLGDQRVSVRTYIR